MIQNLSSIGSGLGQVTLGQGKAGQPGQRIHGQTCLTQLSPERQGLTVGPRSLRQAPKPHQGVAQAGQSIRLDMAVADFLRHQQGLLTVLTGGCVFALVMGKQAQTSEC